MTPNNTDVPPPPASTDHTTLANSADAHSGLACPIDDSGVVICQVADCQLLSVTRHPKDVDNDGMAIGRGAARFNVKGEEVTRELIRFSLLVTQLVRDTDLSQAQIGRLLGMDKGHLSKLVNYETAGYTGLSADIVRKVRDQLKISPEYFFDDYEGEAEALKVYSLDAARKKARDAVVDDRLHTIEQEMREMRTVMLDMQKALISKDSEIARLRHELERPRPRR
jgi:transcriptional regulator with XRE-family HTH domain